MKKAEKIEQLKKKYEYYNFFNLDENLEILLSKIISEKENNEYNCKLINATCLAHDKIIHTEKIDNYRYNWDGEFTEYSVNSGIQESITHIDEEKHMYFVIYDTKYEGLIKNIEFKSWDTIEDYLSRISLFYNKCSNVIEVGTHKNSKKTYCIDIKKLEEILPYLKDVFYVLNEWRHENNRTTLDNSVLNDQIQKLKKK